MLLKFPKELLSMTARLWTSPTSYEFLNFIPVLSVFYQALKELCMLLIGPLSFIEYKLWLIAADYWRNIIVYLGGRRSSYGFKLKYGRRFSVDNLWRRFGLGRLRQAEYRIFWHSMRYLRPLFFSLLVFTTLCIRFWTSSCLKRRSLFVCRVIESL
jgi:hypothetical protein